MKLTIEAEWVIDIIAAMDSVKEKLNQGYFQGEDNEHSWNIEELI